MKPVPLESARAPELYGGKSHSLGVAIRGGLPVPEGRALSVHLVNALAAGDEEAGEWVRGCYNELGGGVAVRSSALGEDSEEASFAGQHMSVLNVHGADKVVDAVIAVHASAHTEAALAYRRKVGIEAPPSVAVLVQRLIEPESAGVMFTRHPVNHADERVIEAAWGLGEAVVSGIIVPDSYRLSRDGAVLDRTPGEKDFRLRAVPGGGTEEVEVEADLVNALALDDDKLARLHALACDCEQFYGEGLDIEWAFAGGELYLLQCRAITTR